MRECVSLFPSNSAQFEAKPTGTSRDRRCSLLNKRRTDDGTISVALAARHSDPYSGADLAIWWAPLTARTRVRDRRQPSGPVSATLVSDAPLRLSRQFPLDNIRPLSRCRSRYALLSL